MTGHFTDINGVRYRVTVGTAAGTLTLGEDAVHITWERPDHLFVGLRCASCDIRVRTSVDLSSLYTDDPLGTMVTVDMLDANDEVDKCVFYGFLVPQEWEATYSGLNDDVLLTAVDALAALKGLHYMSVNGHYPQGLSAQSILARGCQLVAFDTIPTLPYNGGTINEQAFLPRYEDVSEYSGERKTWAEVLEAIAVWEGVCLMQNPEDATELMAIDIIDRVENGTADDIDVKGEDSAGADIRMSIEPARSRVVVNYEDLSPMPLMPEITSDRFEGSSLSSTRVNSSDHLERTEAKYYMAKDWQSRNATRPGCGAVVTLVDDRPEDDSISDRTCIVGPAQQTYEYLNTRETVDEWGGIIIKFSAWARDDMNVNADGYEELNIQTEASNFDPVFEIWIKNPNMPSYRITKTMNLDGKDGFVNCKIGLDKDLWFNPDRESGFTCAGNISLYVPAHCVITDLSVEISTTPRGWLPYSSTDLSKVENDGIVELKTSGWNDRIEIPAKLRAVECEYAASDCGTLFPGHPELGYNKFPFCKPAQFEVPRKRVQARVNGLWPPLTVVTDEGLSTQKMVIDQADWDLRNAETDLLIEETWEEAEDE
jgi:hypothetical protein